MSSRRQWEITISTRNYVAVTKGFSDEWRNVSHRLTDTPDKQYQILQHLFYRTWQITGGIFFSALRCFNMQLITHTPSSICTLSATESHLTIINDWIRQKLWAATSSSNTGRVCFRLTAPCRRLHSGEWGGLWVVYHVVFLAKPIRGHLHTRGTARLPPGWQSPRWHVWGPGAWRWPGAVCSLRSAAWCPSRWAPRSHFLRSWLEVGSQVQRSASWLCPLLIRKTNEYNTSQLIQESMWEPVTSGVSLNGIRAERKEVINHSCHVSGEEWQTFSCYSVLNEAVMVVSCQMLWCTEYLWILACGSDLKASWKWALDEASLFYSANQTQAFKVLYRNTEMRSNVSVLWHFRGKTIHQLMKKVIQKDKTALD